MELSVTISLPITHRVDDPIPVFLRNGVEVGRVTNVAPTGGGELVVTVQVRDDIMHSAMKAHLDTGLPVFKIIFPRQHQDYRPWEEIVDSYRKT